jgi:hypothetical protein
MNPLCALKLTEFSPRKVVGHPVTQTHRQE